MDSNYRLPAMGATKILPATTFYPAEKYHQDYSKKYRQACGRNARVIELWGNDAFVIAGR